MGSSYYGRAVKAGGEEWHSFAAIKTYLTGLDSRITCANDPEDEFDATEHGSSYKSTLSFSINGTHAFTIYRDKALSETSKTLNVKLDTISGASLPPNNEKGIRNAETEYNDEKLPSYDRVRGFTISHIINNNFILLSFASLVAVTSGTHRDWITICFSFSNNKTYIGTYNETSEISKAKCFNISGYSLYDTDQSTGAVGSFLSRFSYAAPAGEIDYIKSSIYQNNSEKVFENRAVYDCTTVNIGDTVSLKDGSYVAVGTNQLVKVS